MICFPHAKINLGLRIIEKRTDGFHNIETIFYPIHDLYDSLEIIESHTFEFETSGLIIDGAIEDNLCYKAWKTLHETYTIPNVKIHLQKHIPFGAGLGGGSADAAYTLKALNQLFNLQLSNSELEKIALTIGSDCPFFINAEPTFAEGQGEIFSPITISLKNYWLVLANPHIHVSTKEAYAGVTPQKHTNTLKDILPTDISNWKNILINDFEKSVFSKYQSIQELKNHMYMNGATYAAMSGSGSTVFGIFKDKPNIPASLPTIWLGQLS